MFSSKSNISRVINSNRSALFDCIWVNASIKYGCWAHPITACLRFSHVFRLRPLYSDATLSNELFFTGNSKTPRRHVSFSLARSSTSPHPIFPCLPTLFDSIANFFSLRTQNPDIPIEVTKPTDGIPHGGLRSYKVASGSWRVFRREVALDGGPYAGMAVNLQH